MNALSNDTRLPLYQRLHDHLAQQIATHHWRPGEAIPTEAAPSTQYRFSTGTVRKAVDALVKEGLLERQQGRGTLSIGLSFNPHCFDSSVSRQPPASGRYRKAGA